MDFNNLFKSNHVTILLQKHNFIRAIYSIIPSFHHKLWYIRELQGSNFWLKSHTFIGSSNPTLFFFNHNNQIITIMFLFLLLLLSNWNPFWKSYDTSHQKIFLLGFIYKFTPFLRKKVMDIYLKQRLFTTIITELY